MPPKRRGRLYLKGGRYYADLRDLGGKLEAMKPEGADRATTDPDEAGAILERRVRELRAGTRDRTLGISKGPTLLAFAREHLIAKAREGRVTTRTLADTEMQLRRAAAFLGGDRPLAEIRVRDVKAWIAHLRTTPVDRAAGGMTGGTVRSHLNALGNLYRRAIEDELLPLGSNPVAAISGKPTSDADETRWYEVHEAAHLLELARTWSPARQDLAYPFLYPLLATLLLTGGRRAEVYGLRVEDVNFERRTVTFQRTSRRRLKTKHARRVVPLWPQLHEILGAYLEQWRLDRPGELLFPAVRGRDVEAGAAGADRMLTSIDKALDQLAAAAKLPAGYLRTRPCRHTYCATRLQTLDQGAPVSVWTVAKEMGHGDTSLVERIYGHLGEVRQRREVMEYRAEEHRERIQEWQRTLGEASRAGAR